MKMAYPTAPILYPKWNALFEYNELPGTLFQPGSALVIEIYEFDFPAEGPLFLLSFISQ